MSVWLKRGRKNLWLVNFWYTLVSMSRSSHFLKNFLSSDVHFWWFLSGIVLFLLFFSRQSCVDIFHSSESNVECCVWTFAEIRLSDEDVDAAWENRTEFEIKIDMNYSKSDDDDDVVRGNIRCKC